MTDNRSRYFQEIARYFLAKRGAPFFLSAKDLDLISSWERDGIPLPVVLEGIERALDVRRPGSPAKGKVMSLAFCRKAVERAFEQHRDRRIGGRLGTPIPRDKQVLILSEIERFLDRISPDVEFLREIYSEAREKMAGPGIPEDESERLDDEISRLLSARANGVDREALKKELLSEFRPLDPKTLGAALEIKLTKLLRERYRIPYLSAFYY